MPAGEISRMFAGIAGAYDPLNHLLSLGLDIWWRRVLARRAGIGPSAEVLDVCTGTADLAIALARCDRSSQVTAVDFSAAMLDVGRRKIEGRGLANSVQLVRADAMDLPFPDRKFDTVCVAFGLRNLPDRRRGILEMVRVLKPGGRLLVLEFSPPRRSPLGLLFAFYLSTVVPLVGGALSGNYPAYRYLHDSIEGFLRPEEVTRLLVDAGLTRVSYLPLAGGTVAIHSGVRPC